MSLDFDVSRVANFREVTTDPGDPKKWHPVTECLVFKTMAVDIGSITEKNVDEFWWRVRLLQLLDATGDLTSSVEGQIYLTRQDIVDHIGLSTNVSTRTRAQWLKRQMERDFRFAPGVLQKESAREITARIARVQAA